MQSEQGDTGRNPRPDDRRQVTATCRVAGKQDGNCRKRHLVAGGTLRLPRPGDGNSDQRRNQPQDIFWRGGDAPEVPTPRVPGGDQDQRRDEHGRHHATTLACRRQASQASAARATTIMAHTSGSGTVGTVAALAGVSPACAYCAVVSRTTAPL